VDAKSKCIMKIQLLNIAFFLLLTPLAGSQKIATPIYSNGDALMFDFAKSTPSDLIELLKNEDRGKGRLNRIAFMDRAPVGWIKKSDIAFLMTLIHSTDTAKCFVSPLSSYACMDCYSTLGGHAIEMIECYRQNTRFPGSFFNCPTTDQQKVKDLAKWRENTWR
jgi:hypothetical protein